MEIYQHKYIQVGLCQNNPEIFLSTFGTHERMCLKDEKVFLFDYVCLMLYLKRLFHTARR